MPVYPPAMSDAGPPESTPAEPTARQRQILDIIERFSRRSGFFPPVRVIAEAAEITVGTAHYHITNLRDMGLLPTHGQHSRGVDIRGIIGVSTGTIPVCGLIAAGGPILAEENIEGTFRVDPTLPDPDELYALKVRGESMVGKGILPGDTIVVRPQKDVANGDIVAVLIGEEATVKEYQRGRDGKIRLVPYNDAYAVIEIDGDRSERDGDHVEILGKVVQVSRTL
jgi:repressor LexA